MIKLRKQTKESKVREIAEEMDHKALHPISEKEMRIRDPYHYGGNYGGDIVTYGTTTTPIYSYEEPINVYADPHANIVQSPKTSITDKVKNFLYNKKGSN